MSTPTPQGISALLKRAGFTRSDSTGGGGAGSGYVVSLERARGKAASVRVRYHSRSAGWSSSPEYVKEKLAQYTEILAAAGWTVEAGEYELIVTTGKAGQ